MKRRRLFDRLAEEEGRILERVRSRPVADIWVLIFEPNRFIAQWEVFDYRSFARHCWHERFNDRLPTFVCFLSLDHGVKRRLATPGLVKTICNGSQHCWRIHEPVFSCVLLNSLALLR